MSHHRDQSKRAIADLALLGDGKTAALVDRAGVVCWCCWPRFDSPAIFASLIGDEENGEWRIAPSTAFTATRRYVDETAILETHFETEQGSMSLTDFMPFGSDTSALVRRLRGLSGKVDMSARLAPRGGYGRHTPRYVRENGQLKIDGGDFVLKLHTSRDGFVQGEAATPFVVRAGDSVDFILTDAYTSVADVSGFANDAEARCAAFWRAWTARCSYRGPARAIVLRSLITLKALIYAPSGGMVAAPTTSLPEHLPGSRNWDYRFCWLRDSTFTLLALIDAGYDDEARAWTRWLEAMAARTSPKLEVFAGVVPGEPIDETSADWLSGFADSRPVRIGNAARTQLQLGIYGEVQDALHQWRLATGDAAASLWPLQRAMLAALSGVTDQPDSGIWEQRDKQEFFRQSRVLAWVALDRAQRSADKFGFHADPSWRRQADKLHAEICARGFDETLGAFTRAYGSRSLDASCLLLMLVGFLPPTDPRLVGTVEAIRRKLGDGPYVHRYGTGRETDGVGCGEGAFLACSFWLADNLILMGRRDEAADIFDKNCASINDLGLLSEEFDVANKHMLGNFPQALTHLSLVHTALNLQGEGPAHRRSRRTD